MVTINNIDDKYFEFNGVRYFKNFTPIVVSDKIEIKNTYDSRIVLTDEPILFSNFTVDGVTFTSVAELQIALLPVIYVRNLSSLEVTETVDTSNVIDLSSVLGNLCNMASANTITEYEYENEVLGGNATILINAATEPTITSANKIKGSTFLSNTDMYLRVWFNGNVVEYWFEQIAI